MSPENSSSIDLLKQIISIPSHVDPNTNENPLVDFLEIWAKENLLGFTVERQVLAGNRHNLILKKGNPDTIFFAHTDTVAPSIDSPYPQLQATEVDGYIWGRGATDMKSGLASMLYALKVSPSVNNIWYFLYADEEYDFLGMKGLVEKFGNIKPKLLVSSDGSDLQIGHGCRGLIEFRGRFIGKTGHPAKENGVSAIQQGFYTLNQLQEFVSEYSHPTMGKSTFNVAYLLGGAQTSNSYSKDKKLVTVGQAGNVIPDVAEFVLDIRPATPELTLDLLKEHIARQAEANGVEFYLVDETHALGAWYTELSEIQPFVELAKSINSDPISPPRNSGYIDLQMFWDKVGRPPAFMYGGGLGQTAHTSQERIKISDFYKEVDFFESVLKTQPCT